MQEMTKISQIVSFFLRHPKHAHAPVILRSTDGLPQRPAPAPAPAPKNENRQQRDARKSVLAASASALKRWDPIDQEILEEVEQLRFLHAGRSLTESSKPSGYVVRRSEEERHEANLAELAEKKGVQKTSTPPPGAAMLPKRGEAVSESTPGLFALMYPDIFPTGMEDFNEPKR